ncbi:hypothetical protein HPT25_22140 [Bacillus sp. BRMEA1]|uniref:hypothetical protein n=1 Tax=Neobacillus endophyticus TaxID=2738405 RepID=UPI001565D88A|nr:hypothetical protein [Neobacillus endophyticus]NRD80041.1 hypothetical protein [Neobacillus endophyticus]
MFFSNMEHQNNYNLLMSKYRLKSGEDTQYESNIYMCSYPPIFDCIEDLSDIDYSFGPLFYFTVWDDEEETHVVSAPGLTGSTRRMVELGLSCYNGFPIGLDDLFSSIASEELKEVVFTTMKIRARKI